MGFVNTMPMPKYKCHKEVFALKIKELKRDEPPAFSKPVCRGSAALGTACGHCDRCKWYEDHGLPKTFFVPEEPNFAPIELSSDYLSKHNPKVGGYFVVYEDGYQSFSPADAFEGGYTRIN